MFARRLKQLVPAGPLLAASLAQVKKRCGQPSCSCHHGGPLHPASCSCHHGGPLHPAHHLTFTERGKTRTVYVPQDLLTEVQLWVQEYQRLKVLIHEIS